MQQLDLQVQAKEWGDRGTGVLMRQTKGGTDGCEDHGYDAKLGYRPCRTDTRGQTVDSGQGSCGNLDGVYDEE